MRVRAVRLVTIALMVTVSCTSANPGLHRAHGFSQRYSQAEDFKALAATAGSTYREAGSLAFCASSPSPSQAVSCALRSCRERANRVHAISECEITMLGDHEVSAFSDLSAMMVQYEQEIRGTNAAAQPPGSRPRSTPTADSDHCQWARDGECDDTRYLGAISGACRHGSDASDCRGLQLRPPQQLVGNTCQWAFDGECDDSRYIGAITGVCRHGTDMADCGLLRLRSRQELVGNTCRWAFDGECDHPHVGTGACPAGTDAADCGGH